MVLEINMDRHTAKLYLGTIIIFSLAIRIPALFIPHVENDEVIYQTLAEKISKNLADYTLQGTPLIDQLPKASYDYPIFRHPPLFIWSIALIKIFLGPAFEILLPICSGILIIILTYLIAKKLYSEEHGLLAGLITAFCPILLFTSTKIWIETTFTVLMCAAFYLLLIACQKQKMRWFLLAGGFLGCSLLAKQTALGIIPVAIYVFARQRIGIKKMILFIASFFLTSLLINLPWLIHYYKIMGKLTYENQYKITEEAMRMFPFIKTCSMRPFYYLVVFLPFVYPAYFLSWGEIILRLKERKNLSEVIWGLTFMIGLTFLGIIKYLGFNMRFLVPALPAFAILGAGFTLRYKHLLLPLLLIFLGFGLVIGLLNSYIIQSADVFPLNDFLPAIQATPRAAAY